MGQHVITQLSPFHLAMGHVPGAYLIDVLFSNSDIDTISTPQTIWPLAGIVAIRTAAAVVELVSSNAADDGSPVGTGARTVRVDGLDAEYNRITEDFVMNGTTAVVGVKLFFRINAVYVLTAGTAKSNVGNITIRDSGAGTTRSYISAGRSVSEVGLWTVPAGHTMIAQGWMITSRDTAGAAGLTDVEFWATVNGVRSLSWGAVVAGTLTADFSLPHVWQEKTDVEVIVPRVQSNNTAVQFHGHGILVGPNADF